MDKIIYHGSKNIVMQPKFGLDKLYNDYGRGFYCTESLDLAKEWSVSAYSDGYANQYKLDCSNLDILNLNTSNYTLLHLLGIILENRTFNTSAPLANEAKNYILQNFHVDY